MKGIRDWVFSQILSNSLTSSTPLSGSESYYGEGHRDEEYNEQGTALILTVCAEFTRNTLR